MGKYTHLSLRERCLIKTFVSMGFSCHKIAKRMNRHRGTISRELARNREKDGSYFPARAQIQTKARHGHRANKLETNHTLNAYVRNGLKRGWSPEQLSGRMRQERQMFYACPESIYRYIYRLGDKESYKLLPRQKRKRGWPHHEKLRFYRKKIAIRNIQYRCKSIEARDQIGHWEGDTIHFPWGQKSCVTTLVERKSRYVYLQKNDDKKSKTVISHVDHLIKSTPTKLWKTLTFDQGNEFMNYRFIERGSKVKVYFCDTRSPWQRGSNENTNGRLRRYLPKTFKIDAMPQCQLDIIAELMNNTPRKCLGYLTPKEMMNKQFKGVCRTSL